MGPDRWDPPPRHEPSVRSNHGIPATVYFKRGWQPLRLRVRQKKPCGRDWPRSRVAETDLGQFKADDNIGVLLGEPSGNLVDVDLDCDEAVDLAPEFLPPTDAVSGREGRWRSHWWYISPEAASKTFAAQRQGTTKRDTLLELRSTGQQTMVPPSVHPCGEEVEWSDDGDPAVVQAPLLFDAARRLATASVLVRAGVDRTEAIDAARGDPATLVDFLADHPDARGAIRTWWSNTPWPKEKAAGDSRAKATREAAASKTASDTNGWSSTFASATATYNEKHAREYGPPGKGTCPACGHNDCFGQLADDSMQWACFSTGHEKVGQQGDRCWFGDVLDLDAHAAGRTPAEHLRVEGYLGPRARPRSGGTEGWQAQLLKHRDKDGDLKITPCRANVRMILRDHPAWQGVLAYDLFHRRP